MNQPIPVSGFASEPVNGQGFMWQVRNFVFFAGVFLMFYTLPKPAPVDMAFVAAMGLSPFVNQKITRNFLLMLLVMGTWCLSFYIASTDVWRDPEVKFEIFQKTYVVLLGFLVCLMAMSWQHRHFVLLLKVYVASCVVAATLGIAGFATGMELLSSYGRAKGIINDPNMYCAFLVPGAMACLYLLPRTRWKLFVMGVTGYITLGLLLSFSRSGIMSLIVCGGMYIAYVNRHTPMRLIAMGVAALAGFGMVVVLLFAFGGEGFTRLVEDRLTVAKAYDLGREGRYARYERAVPIIIDNPLGIGVVQDEKIFVEPIHNIWIGSFLLYGWIGGLAWIAFFTFTVAHYVRNQRATDDPLPTLMFMCFLSTVFGATLHEGEHWRPLWIFAGMVWGMNIYPARQVAAYPAALPARG
jgi:hypothetical protein